MESDVEISGELGLILVEWRWPWNWPWQFCLSPIHQMFSIKVLQWPGWNTCPEWPVWWGSHCHWRSFQSNPNRNRVHPWNAGSGRWERPKSNSFLSDLSTDRISGSLHACSNQLTKYVVSFSCLFCHPPRENWPVGYKLNSKFKMAYVVSPKDSMAMIDLVPLWRSMQKKHRTRKTSHGAYGILVLFPTFLLGNLSLVGLDMCASPQWPHGSLPFAGIWILQLSNSNRDPSLLTRR